MFTQTIKVSKFHWILFTNDCNGIWPSTTYVVKEHSAIKSNWSNDWVVLWVLMCMIHWMCLYQCINADKYWPVSTHNTQLNHLASLAKWLNFPLQTKWFEFRCCHLIFRYRAYFEQGVPWHSGNCRVQIHSKTRFWHDKNTQYSFKVL